jgi:hypothetical protein
MTKKRLPGAGERVRAGRRPIMAPKVRSMTDPAPAVPTTSGDAKPEKPTDERVEEVIRIVKAAYQ